MLLDQLRRKRAGMANFDDIWIIPGQPGALEKLYAMHDEEGRKILDEYAALMDTEKMSEAEVEATGNAMVALVQSVKDMK